MSLVVRVVWAWDTETGDNIVLMYRLGSQENWQTLWKLKSSENVYKEQTASVLVIKLRRAVSQYLHAGAVCFAADQSRRDVGVSELVVQVDHVRHPARQEELVPLSQTRPEHHAVDVPSWGGRRWRMGRKDQRRRREIIYQQEVDDATTETRL